MKLALVCQRGYTEKNKRFVNALFRESKHTPPVVVPVGSTPPPKGVQLNLDAKLAGDISRAGKDINSLFKNGLVIHRKKAPTIPEAVLILWDTDCYENLAQLKKQLCDAVKHEYRNKTYVYFAHPEPEIWIVADGDSCLASYFSEQNARIVMQELQSKGLRCENPEAHLPYDRQKKCCQKKISQLLASAIKNKVGTKFSKRKDVPEIIEHINWAAVADKLPTFKPFYDEWLAPHPVNNKTGCCA